MSFPLTMVRQVLLALHRLTIAHHYLLQQHLDGGGTSSVSEKSKAPNRRKRLWVVSDGTLAVCEPVSVVQFRWSVVGLGVARTM